MKNTGIIALIVAAVTIFPGLAHSSELTDTIDTAALFLQTGKPDSAAVLLYDVIDAVDDADERVRALYFLSQALGELGRTGEKIQYLARAEEIAPNAPYADRVRYAHAEALLKTGNANGCISITQDFFKSYSNSPLIPDVLFLTGDAYISRGEWNKALTQFSEITGNYRDSPISREAAVKEGVCLFKLRLISGSIERFEKYLAESPKGPVADEALYYLGLSYDQSGHSGAAVKTFKRLTLNYPSYPSIMDAYYRLGKNLFEERKYIEAENAFTNYLENTRRTDPSYDDALFYMERIAFHKGYYTSEMEIAEHFVAKNPTSRLAPRLFLDLARYYRLSDDIERAIENYRNIVELHPRSEFADSAIFYEADLYVSLNRVDDAMDFLQEMVRRKTIPARAQAVYFKLGALSEEEMPSDAIAWYDSSVSIGASQEVTVKSLMGIARCYHDVNRWLDSSHTYERILRSFPNTPYRTDVYYSLAGIYYLMGRLNEAIQTAKDGLKSAQGKRKTDFQVFLADVYEYVDTDQALQYNWSVWSNNTNPLETRVEALLKMGDISAKRGDRKSAQEAYARVINSKSDSLYIKKAQKRLGELDEISDSPDEPRPQ